MWVARSRGSRRALARTRGSGTGSTSNAQSTQAFAVIAGTLSDSGRSRARGSWMCRALKVVCVATDDSSLALLRAAAVSAEWELAPGATTGTDALAGIDVERSPG